MDYWQTFPKYQNDKERGDGCIQQNPAGGRFTLISFIYLKLYQCILNLTSTLHGSVDKIVHHFSLFDLECLDA